MSLYNQEFNKDHVVIRYIIVSLLAELRNKIYYFNIIDEDSVVKVNVPFFYSVTGDERFLVDNFVYDAQEEGKAKGDYEVVPRGVLQLENLNIDSGNLINKFVRSEFVREFNGQLKTFSLNTAYIPITLSFSATVICSNNLEMLKVTESIVSKLYKSNLYQVDLGMFRIEASMKMPDDYSQNKPFEFTIDDKKEFSVTFSVDVSSFIPVFEGGILLSEINQLIRNTQVNPNAAGIGTYKNGEITFGSIFQEFDISIADISKAPVKSTLSNSPGSYNDSTATDFLNDSINSKKINTEDSFGKSFRNNE